MGIELTKSLIQASVKKRYTVHQNKQINKLTLKIYEVDYCVLISKYIEQNFYKKRYKKILMYDVEIYSKIHFSVIFEFYYDFF